MNRSTRTLTMTLSLTLVALLAACGEETNEPGSDLIPQTFKVSECGGFQKATQSQTGLSTSSYCAAEVLKWSYDKATATLKLSDNRALLNCCGERKMSLTENNGVYEILETDSPEAKTGARCHCMCVFDLSMDAQQIPDGVVSIKLMRHVTDSGAAAKQIYAGSIDLTKGSGQVILDSTDVGPWCSK